VSPTQSDNQVNQDEQKVRLPIAHSARSITKFLSHVESSRVPRRVTNDYLAAMGLDATNDSELRGIFRRLGFLDRRGRPTDLWRDYRHSSENKRQSLMQGAVMQIYAPLYQQLPEAHLRSTSAVEAVLGNFVRTRSSLDRAMRTFVTLTSSAGLPHPTSSVSEVSEVYHFKSPLQIVIALPASKSYDLYVSIFQALKVVFY
jgi:hypothetical protein